jgi:serine/threonine protein kinase
VEDQLVREIKLQSYFNHDNFIKLYDFFSDESNIYLLMKYMEEGTLYTLLKIQKKFPEAYISDRIRELCTALYYLHYMDVVHRDIK